MATSLSSFPIGIDKALADPALLGACLGPVEPSWNLWNAVLKAAFGLALTEVELEAFRSVSGHREPPPGPVQELWACVGRRSGKTRIASAIAVYLAACIAKPTKLAFGETGCVLLLSPTQAQARIAFDYCRDFLEASPLLRGRIKSIKADEIRLRGGITIGVHSNSYRHVRGRTLLACLFDESAFWRDESSGNPDVETYRAVLPSLATTGGMLIGISSPYRKVGLLYTRHRDFFGKDDTDTLVIAGSSQQFNPTLNSGTIDKARRDDPEAARSEWDGLFREDISSLLDDALIDAAVEEDRPLELSPAGHSYVAFLDPSGGKHDCYTCCIGHVTADGVFIADVVRGEKPPLDPAKVTARYVELARSYGTNRIISDAYAGEWVTKAVADAGGIHEVSSLNKSQLYLEAVPLFAQGKVSIPEHDRLLRELRLLERRTSRSGKDSVDHPQSGSDDFANAVCGCAVHATQRLGREVSAADMAVAMEANLRLGDNNFLQGWV